MAGGQPRAAVLGSPVAHSLSPVMHRAAYGELGLGWAYERHECDEAGLAPFLAGLDDDWRGLSLTMPLKEEALRLAESVEPVAAEVGAVNTLVRTATGWSGHNTDVAGIRAALRREGITSAERVLVLGSGATTRSALAAVGDLGAAHVTFAVRAGVRPETVELAERFGMTTEVLPLAQVPGALTSADLVVDTLPGASADAVADAIADARGERGDASLPPLFEVIYEGWPTRLARTFAAAGAPVASGLVMLAYQGAEQVRLMTGVEQPDETWTAVAETMLAAAERELARG